MMPMMSHQIRGQALTELAIFGSIMLMVLAAMVRFGLQYLYLQETTQETFRAALGEAHRLVPGPRGGMISLAGSVQRLDDRYLPDPSRPFGIGERAPFMGVAGVTWTDDAIVRQADTDRELPVMKMIVNGQSVTLRRAGYLAWVTPKPAGSFGAQFERLAHIFCNDEADTKEEFAQCEGVLRRKPNQRVHNGYITLLHGPGPADNQVIEVVGFTGSGFRNVSIVMDGCAGHVFNPEACKVQCDNLDGVEHRRPTGSRPLGVRLVRPRLPYPSYCNRLWDNPTGDRRFRKLNPAAIINPLGLDVRNVRRNIVSSNRVTAASPGRQVGEFDRSETLGNRLLRYQTPAATPGGSFAERTTSFPLPTDPSTGSAVLDNETTHEQPFRDRHQETWTTP